MDDHRTAPSKTRLKKEMHALQNLGAALAEMPHERLAALPIPESLHEAVREFQRTRSHEGRRRQMQYIGKLMRQADAEPIREAIAAQRIGGARETLLLHTAERWRDELLAGDEALARWLQEYPASDARRLRSLVQAARAQAPAPEKPGAAVRRGRAYRELFLFIKSESAA